MKNEYLISVIIPAYNRGYVIEEALDSIFNQGISGIQVIVIDDGSTDDTAQIIQKYPAEITYHYQENQGPSVARNTGLALAKGSYISFLDSDDIFEPKKFEKELKLFQQYPEVETIISDAELWLFNQRLERSGLHKDLKFGKTPFLLSNYSELWQSGIISPTCCHTFKRASLDKLAEPFFDPTLTTWEDWDFSIKLYHHTTTLVFPEVTAIVRRFDDNTRGDRHIPGMEQTPSQVQSSKKFKAIVSQRLATL